MTKRSRARSRTMEAARRTGLEVLGWTLVVLGIAALVLPGPGLLMLFAGLAVLSQQYDWAERRLEPVKRVAFRAAAEGVKTWPRILASASGALIVMGVGVTWGVGPSVPPWWPLAQSWWLPGGWGAGVSIIVSGLIAFGLLVYSYGRFRERGGEPAAPGEPVDPEADAIKPDRHRA